MSAPTRAELDRLVADLAVAYADRTSSPEAEQRWARLCGRVVDYRRRLETEEKRAAYRPFDGWGHPRSAR